MAHVDIYPQKTKVSGQHNSFEFDTRMATKGYPFFIHTDFMLIELYIDYSKYSCFSIDMDLYYRSEYFNGHQYLIVPAPGFSYENFIKWCAEYVDPLIIIENRL